MAQNPHPRDDRFNAYLNLVARLGLHVEMLGTELLAMWRYRCRSQGIYAVRPKQPLTEGAVSPLQHEPRPQYRRAFAQFLFDTLQASLTLSVAGDLALSEQMIRFVSRSNALVLRDPHVELLERDDALFMDGVMGKAEEVLALDAIAAAKASLQRHLPALMDARAIEKLHQFIDHHAQLALFFGAHLDSGSQTATRRHLSRLLPQLRLGSTESVAWLPAWISSEAIQAFACDLDQEMRQVRHDAQIRGYLLAGNPQWLMQVRKQQIAALTYNSLPIFAEEASVDPDELCPISLERAADLLRPVFIGVGRAVRVYAFEPYMQQWRRTGVDLISNLPVAADAIFRSAKPLCP